MSKAFTRESDDAGAEELPVLRPAGPVGAKTYITRAGADRLRERLRELLEERRVLASGADPNAKAALHRLDAEVQKVQATLSSAIVAEVPTDQEKVALGASVRVRDEEGDEDTYQIVGVEETDPAQGRISSASPLARALLGKRAGDTVRFESPAGVRQLVLLQVEY